MKYTLSNFIVQMSVLLNISIANIQARLSERNIKNQFCSFSIS